MATLADFAIGNAVPGGLSPVTGVSDEMTRRFLTMAEAMPPELRAKLQIISAFRSPGRQAQVNPEVKNSRHSHGLAFDLGNDPAVLQWIGQHPEHGLGFPLRYMGPKEYNHLEMIDEAGSRYIPTGDPRFKSGLHFGVASTDPGPTDYGGGGDVDLPTTAQAPDTRTAAALLALSQAGSGGGPFSNSLGSILQGLQPPAQPAPLIPTQQQLVGDALPLSRRIG